MIKETKEARTVTIKHVTRIEGHARISIHLDEAGGVAGAQLHVTQIRGFEKFVQGRPFYEMPAITSRICGICPVSHLLASAKACEAIMTVELPPAAAKLRELVHCAQFVQSHALSFFYLSSPDLLLGFESDPSQRNIAGLLEQHPEVARSGILLRKFGQHVIERLAGERVHPAWIVPGGVNKPLSQKDRDAIVEELPVARALIRHTLQFFQEHLGRYQEEIESFSGQPTAYAALTSPEGALRLYHGEVRFVDQEGKPLAGFSDPNLYRDYIDEAVLPFTYLKAPYFKPLGYPGGVYRVGPLARLNVAERCGTPEADAALNHYRERFGRMPHSAFLYHYARLIEAMHAVERMEELLKDPEILSPRVRAFASVNSLQGVGIIEAPRGLLIHDYQVDENGAIKKVNLIVATGHNNLAIGSGLQHVARRYIHGPAVEEGALNRVAALVRAYDPCLSCSTHSLGRPAFAVDVCGPRGETLRRLYL